MDRAGLVGISAPAIDPGLAEAARRAIGFMPEDEGIALYEAGLTGAARGPLLEIGSYCGKSAIYLGAAARAAGAKLYSIDHHRGSEEHQPGQEYFDPRLYDESAGRVDTWPEFQRTIAGAGLGDVVEGIVGDSAEIAVTWETPLGLVFVDGGHSARAAHADYEGWSRHLVDGGFLLIHDVFEDPAQGGRPPYEIWSRAVAEGGFVDSGATGSLRVLRRTGDAL
jgi:predicted O-methyltransferase YrrM